MTFQAQVMVDPFLGFCCLSLLAPVISSCFIQATDLLYFPVASYTTPLCIWLYLNVPDLLLENGYIQRLEGKMLIQTSHHLKV